MSASERLHWVYAAKQVPDVSILAFQELYVKINYVIQFNWKKNIKNPITEPQRDTVNK